MRVERRGASAVSVRNGRLPAVDLWTDITTHPVTALEAFATTGALLVTAFVWRGSLKDKRRAQAELVHAWFGPCPSDAGHFHSLADHDPISLHVRNGSDAPVYSIAVVNERLISEAWSTEVLPPQTMRAECSAREFLGLLDRYGAADLRIWFTDSAGRAWTRGGKGGTLRRQRLLDDRAWARLMRRVLPMRLSNPVRWHSLRQREEMRPDVAEEETGS